jgi:hypothetical protein
MRFWLALGRMLLLSATANAQCVEFPAADGRPLVRVCPQERPRECDDHGCYFDDLKKWRAPNALQEDLQRRAEEARRKLESSQKNSK